MLDPWTALKNANNTSFPVGTETVGRSGLYKAGTYYPDRSADPNVWAGFVQPGTTVTDGYNEEWQRIGYTFENTTAASASGEYYSTGVVFKAKFTPAVNTVQGDYTAGRTFFKYAGVLFATMEDLMKWIYTDFDNFDNRINACSSWADVQNFATSLGSADPSGYADYLTEKAEGQSGSLTETDKQGLTWSAYMLAECGYSSNGGVTLDQNGKVTREVLRPNGVQTYEDATCYYTWWVRHSDDNSSETNGVMEYAIVRNNIYKLRVNSVAGLGGDVPGDNEEGNIVIRVTVNNWTLLDPETIYM